MGPGRLTRPAGDCRGPLPGLAGAASAGFDPEPWRALGDKIGEAYQVADDLRDVLCTAEELGKPIGQDAARYRPNAAAQLGGAGAKARLEHLVELRHGKPTRPLP